VDSFSSALCRGHVLTELPLFAIPQLFAAAPEGFALATVEGAAFYHENGKSVTLDSPAYGQADILAAIRSTTRTQPCEMYA
jgi:hypothetical protein